MGFEKSITGRKVKASSMTGFIHFKDLSTSHSAGENARSSELPSSGTMVFTGKSPIMDQPSSTGQVIDYYYAGESVSYDQVLEKDGYKWLGYLIL